MDDLSIIELYFARDEQAIKETDAKYGKLCHSIAYNILNNNEDSEECVNDTYIGVWNTIPPTRPNNFMAFVCRITRNLSLKRIEAMARQSVLKQRLFRLMSLRRFYPMKVLQTELATRILEKLSATFCEMKKRMFGTCLFVNTISLTPSVI